MTSTSGIKGFLIKSVAPRASPFFSASTSSLAVRKITGISAISSSIAISSAMVSKPSISGILTSRSIRFGLFSLRKSRSALPDLRAVTRILFLLSMCPASLRLAISSSTTATHGCSSVACLRSSDSMNSTS